MAYCVWGEAMSNLVIFAKQELERAGLLDKDSDYNGELGKATLQLVHKFSEQEHSGISASIVTHLVAKLMAYEPITPLTGEDDEWILIGGEIMGQPGVYQNKRCSRVFKEGDRAYDIEGRVFVDKDGSTSTNRKSHTTVKFPYVPKTVYVQRRWWKFWL